MNGSGFGFGEGSAEADGLAFVYDEMANNTTHTYKNVIQKVKDHC